MLTRTVTTDEPQALELALQTYAAGLVIFPTDTLYGLSCDPTNPPR
jgi:tRNA A37 threonylcarbamoyladenosine synthetase subunit TsaC/SUA5/YrdC